MSVRKCEAVHVLSKENFIGIWFSHIRLIGGSTSRLFEELGKSAQSWCPAPLVYDFAVHHNLSLMEAAGLPL
ncbi:hypothetical protein [Rhizobium sp. NFR07]|uniref:hypothetical protein n=1 Tax=Rhizobium sp. NFR07 TaxID=1566262 RepID=UPI0011603BF8|nr:hypothetical protein [Rhizobium sp. NFR07]